MNYILRCVSFVSCDTDLYEANRYTNSYCITKSITCLICPDYQHFNVHLVAYGGIIRRSTFFFYLGGTLYLFPLLVTDEQWMSLKALIKKFLIFADGKR